jgi:aldehyde dehydrogenase (NAD+)
LRCEAKIYRDFIANEWLEAVGGEHIGVRDPFAGREIARLARGTRDDIDIAVKAARAAHAGQVFINN